MNNTRSSIQFQFAGKTYTIDRAAAESARALVLPTGVVVGIEWTEGIPAEVKTVSELGEKQLAGLTPEQILRGAVEA